MSDEQEIHGGEILRSLARIEENLSALRRKLDTETYALRDQINEHDVAIALVSADVASLKGWRSWIASVVMACGVAVFEWFLHGRGK